MTTDRDARKQLLLTRIAFERVTLRRDLARVRDATSLPRMLRAALPESVGQALLGTNRLPANAAGWLALGLGLLRRYRTVTTLLGGLALAPGAKRPGWQRIKRYGMLAALGVGGWLGWRATQRR